MQLSIRGLALAAAALHVAAANRAARLAEPGTPRNPAASKPRDRAVERRADTASPSRLTPAPA